MLTLLIATALLASDVQVTGGDTLRADGRDYRVYRLEAPQSGIYARCAREVRQAQALQARVRDLIAEAHRVDIVPAFDPRGPGWWPHDRAGRRLARIMLDGRDLSEILIGEGNAERFERNQEYNWCAG